MGVVVDVDVPGLSVLLEPVEVYTLFVVLADVVTYDNITVSSLHNAAEPHIVMAVVVLDEGIDTVVIGVIAASVAPVVANVAVRFVVLDFDPVGVKTENAVSRIVSAAVGQCVVFIDCVFADASDDVISPGAVDIIARHVNLRPQIVTDRVMGAKLDAPAGGGVSNAHTPDSHNSVVRDAKVMDQRRFKALYMDMDASAFFSGNFAVNIVYVAVVDVYMFVCPLRSFY